MSEPSETAVKTLFTHSGNKCFYIPCDEDLTDPRGKWRRVNGEVAHIKGEHPTAPRYDAAQPDAERQGFDNLMLLCPKHHKLIDWLEPDDHPPDRLAEMRAKHLQIGLSSGWRTTVTDQQLASWASDAIEYLVGFSSRLDVARLAGNSDGPGEHNLEVDNSIHRHASDQVDLTDSPTAVVNPPQDDDVATR